MIINGQTDMNHDSPDLLDVSLISVFPDQRITGIWQCKGHQISSDCSWFYNSYLVTKTHRSSELSTDWHDYHWTDSTWLIPIIYRQTDLTPVSFLSFVIDALLVFGSARATKYPVIAVDFKTHTSSQKLIGHLSSQQTDMTYFSTDWHACGLYTARVWSMRIPEYKCQNRSAAIECNSNRLSHSMNQRVEVGAVTARNSTLDACPYWAVPNMSSAALTLVYFSDAL